MTDQDKPDDRLESFWVDVRGGRPVPEPKPDRFVQHPGEMVIATNQRMLVGISPDGTLRFGEGYTPDEAAETFWTAMALKRKGMEERLVHLGILEQMLVSIGRADLRTEQLRLQARLETSTADDHFRAEMAMRNLEALVHQLIEVGRGLALRENEPPADPPPVPPGQHGDEVEVES